MNIVEEFFIKYGTDAKDAARDVEALDQKIAALAVKGAKRSEEEQKQLKELRKQRQAQIADLKDITHGTDKLNLSFSNLLTVGGSALLAFKTLGDVFSTIKDAVVEAANYNFELSKTASLTGISARELSIWDGAVQQAGGSAGEFLGFITKLNAQYATLGVNDRIKNVTSDLLTLSKAWDGLSSDQRQQRAAQLGLGPGEVLLLNQGYDKMVQILQAQQLYNNQGERSAEIGQEIYQTQVNVDKQWRAIGTDLEPLYQFWVKLKLAFADSIRIVLDLGSAIVRVAQAGVQLAGLNFHGAWKTLTKAGGDLSEAGDQFWEGGKQLGGTGQYAKGTKVTQGSNQILPLISKYESDNRNILNASGPGGTPASSASGYYQIINGTWRQFAPKAGISLSQYPTAMSAPFDIQTKVAEMIYNEQGLSPWASDSKLMAAAYSSLNAANSVPLTSSGNSHSLTVGAITINTQASDASGIARDFHGEMQKQYAQTINSTDDGVAY